MDLKRKLALLKDAGPGSQQTKPAQDQPATQEDSEKKARLDKLRGLIKEVMTRDEPTPEWRDLTEINVKPETLPGNPRNNEHGTVHVAQEHLEPGHCQGHVRIASALEVSAKTIAQLALDPTLEQVDPSKMLFLDTETTGLVGGTGTVPFLVGMAWFEDQSLRVEQLFLRQLGQERPLLFELAKRIDGCSMLVTYNGKTFDWPLLRTRFVMNRLEVPDIQAHFDLLHSARRVYKRRLGALRLVNLEEFILGLHREHDVEGAEIPLRYLDFLRSGKEGQLIPVIEHNAHDLISLAAVLGRLGLHYEKIDDSDDPDDHLGYARVAQRAGDPEKARNFAHKAAQGGGGREVSVDAWMFLAHQSRRVKNVEEQEKSLKNALEAAGYIGNLAAPVHLELAKLCEHKLKDLNRAFKHAEYSKGAEKPEAHLHRMKRLKTRMKRLES